MCGFVAIFGDSNRSEMIQLGKLIEHRGPDEQSYWSDGELSVVFQRLSVVDPLGSHQPLQNEDGNILVWFNGEIYNHQMLRDTLAVSGHRLRERGDGEVIAHLYEDYQEQFPEYLEGMFAFLVYDKRKKAFWVGRDRYGIKPLFYQQAAGRFVFASEVSPLLCTRKVMSLNRVVLKAYLNYRYVPSDEQQLVAGIQKVPAGSLLLLHGGGQQQRTFRYFTDHGHVQSVSTIGAANGSALGAMKPKADSVAQVRNALTHSVRRHLMADVPIGVFLSGGVDSAVMVGLTREALGPDVPLHTFTVIFPEGDSEGERARQISQFHNTIHHELTMTKDLFFQNITKATLHWGGPVSEPAAIPTMLLAEMAKQTVTVVLTGEGADELFAGYPKYAFEARRARTPLLGHIPAWLVPRHSRRLGRLHDALLVQDAAARNINWFGAFSTVDLSDLLTDDLLSSDLHIEPIPQDKSLSGMLKFDRTTWLSQNLLHKFDAMTMAASVEARVPFLDSEVVQTALAIPVSRHLEKGTKSMLKQAFVDLVPAGYLQSPKNGFRVPIAKWLIELNLENLLGEGALVRDGVLKGTGVKRFIQAFRRLPEYHERRLWTLWALEVWYQLTFRNRQVESFRLEVCSR